jgi:pimeloyl-ACP methyl ester carboxylesterase
MAEARSFETRTTKVPPLEANMLLRFVFPERVNLAHACDSPPSERVAFLIHGLAMNEDYFGLLASELIGRGYDVWAVRLPGYVASDETAGLGDAHIGLSLAFYASVVASSIVHLSTTLAPRPTHVLAWGHSLGGAALAAAAGYVGDGWRGPDRLVFEAPAFSEAIAFSGSLIAGFSTAPATILDTLARAFLKDDIRSSDFARRQGASLVPGRTSRAVFNMNVLALTNPFSRTTQPSSSLLERSYFVLGDIDRLVDHDRLVDLLDRWGVACDHRLTLPRNHFLSLTSPKEMVDWVESANRR